MNDYLEKYWAEIENTSRVISIKNLAKELSFILNKDSNRLIGIIRGFFENKQDALFVNDNQIVDRKALVSKDILGIEHLKQILKNEYFIMSVDQDLLASYFHGQDGKLADKGALYRDKKLDKEQIPFPDKLFELHYSCHDIWINNMNCDTKKAQLIWKYLNHVEVPVTIYNIYSDLSGALLNLSIKDINRILYGYENFVHLCDGYWITKSGMSKIDRQIQVLSILDKHINRISLYYLLETYTEKLFKQEKFIPTDNIIKDLELANIYETRDNIEDIFIQLNLVELIPGYWTRKEEDISTGKFSLTNLWQDTYRKICDSIEDERYRQILDKRILGDCTLEQVGKQVGVTRERVRQVEKRLRRRIVSNKNSKAIRPFYEWIINKLKTEKIIDLGEISIREDEIGIFDIIVQKYFNNEKIYRIVDSIVIYKAEYKRLSKKIKKICANKKIINLGEIPLYGGLVNKIKLYDRVFIEKFNMIKLDEKEYFYSGRRPTVEEEIFIIVYKSKRPLHFTEVPRQAEKFNLPLNTEEGRNILATMQRNNLLKRVAPGTYALKEWDIPKHIFITDLIYKVLKDANRPLTYDEIYAGVRKNRVDDVKERSVQYYLACHEEIIYIYTRQYILREWIEEPQVLTQHGIELKKINEQDLLYNRKVILDVFKKGDSYITKYQLSEASFNSTTLRVSRYVDLNLENRIVVIDKYGRFHFHSCGYEAISGINRWKYIRVNDIFYIEFINERISRLLTEKEFDNYMPINKSLLIKAEEFWKKQVEEWKETEELDEGAIENIQTIEELINFGLEKGYVYAETIEKLVDKGHNPMSIRYELQYRDIVINY